MLSAILSSGVTIDVSIKIVTAFVEMRHYLADNVLVFNRLDRIELKQLEADENFRQIIKQLEQPKENKAVLFFKGQLFDAFSCIAEIIGMAGSSCFFVEVPVRS